jgi:hypothetical protein
VLHFSLLCSVLTDSENHSASYTIGHAIAQAVSRLLPTEMAWVRTQVRSNGICGEQSGTGTGFLRVLAFPLPILLPSNAPHSSSNIRGLYTRPISDRRAK